MLPGQSKLIKHKLPFAFIVLEAWAVKHRDFRKCSDSKFCERMREQRADDKGFLFEVKNTELHDTFFEFELLSFDIGAILLEAKVFFYLDDTFRV